MPYPAIEPPNHLPTQTRPAAGTWLDSFDCWQHVDRVKFAGAEFRTFSAALGLPILNHLSNCNTETLLFFVFNSCNESVRFV